METVWDWVTIICFGGLVVLMLQRSVEERTRDHLMEYLFPALGCAVANYLGNHYLDPIGQVGAGLVLVLVGIYVFKVLKFPPIGPNRMDEQDRP
ncbi:MAG: XrtV sorting system accessory protein [Sphingomonas sp.]